MFNFKIIFITLLFFSGSLAHAQSSSLEFDDGAPSGKIDTNELNAIKAYAFDANTSITRILAKINHMEGESSLNVLKNNLQQSISELINNSKDKRSILLLTHSLQAGMIMVNLINKQAIPQGTVSQEYRILKQSLIFARDYYESDYVFLNGILTTQELTTNPKFVDFGTKLTKFIFQMSNGISNVQSSYGMIRWSLAVLANYIKSDKNTGIAYSSTRYNLVKELTQKNLDHLPVYPDLVNGETAPTDIECIMKTRELKYLAKQSFDEIDAAKKSIGEK